MRTLRPPVVATFDRPTRPHPPACRPPPRPLEGKVAKLGMVNCVMGGVVVLAWYVVFHFSFRSVTNDYLLLQITQPLGDT